MTPANHYQFSALLTCVMNVCLLWIILLKGTNKNLIRAFAFYCASIIFWSFFVVLATTINDQKSALLFSQLCHIGANLIPVFFLHFVYVLLGLNIRNFIIRLFDLIAATFVIIIAFYPGLFFNGVSPKYGFPYFPNAGKLYLCWFIYFFSAVMLGHIQLLKAIIVARGIRKKHLLYFTLANLFGYTGGLGCFLPVFDIGVFPFPYGPYGVVLFSFVTAYSIFIHRFLDIEVIIKRTLVFAGLVLMVMSVVTIITAVTQSYISQYFEIPPLMTTILSVLAAIFLYDPVKAWLVRITDRFLFQKKEDVKVVLNALSSNIITILEIQQVGKTVLSTLEKTLRPVTGALYVLHENNHKYICLSTFGGSYDKELDLKHPFIEYLTGRNALINLEMPGTKDHIPKAVLAELTALKIVIALPLYIQKQLIGVLLLGPKKSDQEYANDEINVFPTVAGQVAIALSNARQIDIQKKNQFEYAQQAKLATIGTLVAGIGHEVKNPLQVVKNGLDYMRISLKHGVFEAMSFSDLKTTLTDAVDRMHSGLERVTRIINNISDFSKKRKESVREPVDLEKAADLALELTQYEMKFEDIEIIKRYAGNLPAITADLSRLAEVFLNIIKNARDAIVEARMKDPAKRAMITISSHRHADAVELVIADTGDGIAKENIDLIFDPFFTTKDVSRNNTEKPKGSGLGLHIAKQVVEEFNGRISVESEVGGGTTFRFRFSLKEKPSHAG